MPRKKKENLAKPHPSGVKREYSNKLLEWVRKKFGKEGSLGASLYGKAVTGISESFSPC